MILPLPRMTTYSGKKPCSTSTPIFDLGRSMTWPTEAFTVNPAPRYFLMVFALAGDSTTTRALPLDFFAGFFRTAILYLIYVVYLVGISGAGGTVLQWRGR